MAAVDYFLLIEGIKGESSDTKHKETIEIESFSWGVSNPGSATHGAGGGGGAGKVSFQDFHFTTRVSRASPKLFLACASGEHIKEAKLFCRKAGGDQQDFYTVTMSDLLVSSFQQGGESSSDALPLEEISINYSKIQLEYRPQRADGSTDAPVRGGWDLGKNVGI